MNIPADVKLVIMSGAGGGLASWFYSIMTGTTFGLSRALAFPACLLFGAFAALIAVYGITPTDTKQVGKLLAYAALCGFMWKPVIDAGKIVVTERLKVATEHRTTDQALENITAAAPAGAKPQFDAAKDSVHELLQSSKTLGSPELEEKATEKAKDAVDTIADNAAKDPAAAVNAIQDIQTSARENDNPELARVATARLAMIQQTYRLETTVPVTTETTDTTGTAPTTTTQ